MGSGKQLKAEDYTVGWICALREELMAARIVLDEKHQPPPKRNNWDENVYDYGEINGHYVVIVSLPLAQPGKVSAQRTIQPMRESLPKVNIYLVVGIGGGIPREPFQEDSKETLRLGDVVVGCPERSGVRAVVEWDYQRLHPTYSELLGILDGPGRRVLGALTPIMVDHEMGESEYNGHLGIFNGKKKFEHPGLDKDVLFASDYNHEGPPDMPCTVCDTSKHVERSPRTTTEPVIHLGSMLSSDTVLKDGNTREKLSRRYPHAKCVEMEAASVMNDLHPLIIRGIADYADSHKNDVFRNYAAATAAAFAREFLYRIQSTGPEMRRDYRAESTVSESSTPSIRVDEKVNSAVMLVKHEKTTRKEDLDSVIRDLIPRKADAKAEILSNDAEDYSYYLLISWALIVAEKQLSCHKGFSPQEKIQHVKEAQRHYEEAAQTVSLSHGDGSHVQLMLESSIVEGRLAELELKKATDSEEMIKMGKKAVKGMDESMETLKRIDRDRFYQSFYHVSEWRKKWKSSF